MASHADRTRGRDALEALRSYLCANDLGNVEARLAQGEPRETRDGKLRQVVCRRQ